MADPERILVETVELVRRLANDNHPLARRRRQRRKRRIQRILRGVLVAVIVTFVLVPALIAAGFLLGFKVLAVAPLLLVALWTGIMTWALRQPRTKPEALKKSSLALLPAGAQSQLDAIVVRLDTLTPQLTERGEENEGAAELRRLLGEELPELVRGYRKVPERLTQMPLYGGATPERQLIDGLDTIDKQLARLQERMAQNDLHAFATHQRYLELKYKRDEEAK